MNILKLKVQEVYKEHNQHYFTCIKLDKMGTCTLRHGIKQSLTQFNNHREVNTCMLEGLTQSRKR